MAPSSGPFMLPKIYNAIRYAVSRTAHAVRARLEQQTGAGAQPSAIPIRVTRQPVHPIAALRQARAQQSRSFTTSIRKAIVDTYPSLRQNAAHRASFPASRTSKFIARTPAAPSFASTLRPNLTGGTLPRAAGGYGNVAGKRMFSSVPGTQAQVMQNVSAGVRAFWLGGQRAQFDGLNSVTGEKRYTATGKKEDEVARKVFTAKFDKDSRGTSLEFCVAPSLQTFEKSKDSTFGAGFGLTDAVAPLATDFARSLGALAAVHRDLKRLSSLGNLPITESRPGWLTVRFPGCDGKTVEKLCDELGIYRGVVREDESWAEEAAQDVKMALLFPAAPSDDVDGDAEACFYPVQSPSPLCDQSLENPSYTVDETLSPLQSLDGPGSAPHSFEHVSAPRSALSWQPNPWADVSKPATQQEDRRDRTADFANSKSQQVADMDSIYKFLVECDRRIR